MASNNSIGALTAVMDRWMPTLQKHWDGYTTSKGADKITIKSKIIQDFGVIVRDLDRASGQVKNTKKFAEFIHNDQISLAERANQLAQKVEGFKLPNGAAFVQLLQAMATPEVVVPKVQKQVKEEPAQAAPAAQPAEEVVAPAAEPAPTANALPVPVSVLERRPSFGRLASFIEDTLKPVMPTAVVSSVGSALAGGKLEHWVYEPVGFTEVQVLVEPPKA